jgi:aminoglycoside phosphotransferase (APT) family kinase protein
MQGSAKNTFVPVLKCTCCERQVHRGQHIYIMEFVEGRVLWDQSLPEMTCLAWRDLFRDEPLVIAARIRIH